MTSGAVPGDRCLTGACHFLGCFLRMKDRLPGGLWVKLYIWPGRCPFVYSVSCPDKHSEHLWGDVLSPRPELVGITEGEQLPPSRPLGPQLSSLSWLDTLCTLAAPLGARWGTAGSRISLDRRGRSPLSHTPPRPRGPHRVFPGSEPWPWGLGRAGREALGDVGCLRCGFSASRDPWGSWLERTLRIPEAWPGSGHSVSPQPAPRKQGLRPMEAGKGGQFWVPL